MNIQAIIFDWGRTLYDSDAKVELPESEELLKYFQSKNYRMAVASLVSKNAPSTLEERAEQIASSPLREYFEITKTVATKKNLTDLNVREKDLIFDELVEYFNIPREQILIIGDRTRRDIIYANEHNHPSIWIQKGKFAHELPDEITGQPTYTVNSLIELMDLI